MLTLTGSYEKQTIEVHQSLRDENIVGTYSIQKTTGNGVVFLAAITQENSELTAKMGWTDSAFKTETAESKSVPSGEDIF